MYYSKALKVLLGMLSIITSSQQRTLQPLPLSSSDRWIVDANNNHVPFVGINWPGAADTMLPEGLSYQSIASIVEKISQTEFNIVRLTFAIEMVDDILDDGGDVTLNETLTNALGQHNGTVVLRNIIANNPQFTAETTRLQESPLLNHWYLVAKKICVNWFRRSLTLLLQSWQHRIYTSTWTITSLKRCGAAA